MIFDEITLKEQIIERLTDNTTFFQESNNNTEFEFDDCTVRVSGTVWSTHDCEKGDYYTPPSYDLISRSAELDITLFYEIGVYSMTFEEINAIEKLIEV